MKRRTNLDDTKRLMGALVRMKPKPHEEMKVGKNPASKGATKKKRGARQNQPVKDSGR
jgi:hypothetical protein